jgi:hypothetical protein
VKTLPFAFALILITACGPAPTGAPASTATGVVVAMTVVAVETLQPVTPVILAETQISPATVLPAPALAAVPTETAPPAAVIPFGDDVYVIPIPVPGLVPTPTISGIESGHLWWVNDPNIEVLVIGPEHQEFPLTEWNQDGTRGGVAGAWVARGEACYARAGDLFIRDDSVPHPDFGMGIEVLTGPCAKFRGWVGFPQGSTHQLPPSIHPTASPTGGVDG